MFSERFIDVLSQDPNTVVLTGAGISSESGIPTFRDDGGMWSQYRPEDLANRDAFLKNPRQVWQWYEHRRETIHQSGPNPGHMALKKLEDNLSNFRLVTQNVDNLHQRAGNENILELHGNIDRNRCLDCGSPVGQDQLKTLKQDGDDIYLCQWCGGKIRPDVVWFGESLSVEALTQSMDASRECDLFLVVGTSGSVYPAAGLPLMAQENGAFVAEFNTQESELSDMVNEIVLGPSAETLPELVAQLG